MTASPCATGSRPARASRGRWPSWGAGKVKSVARLDDLRAVADAVHQPKSPPAWTSRRAVGVGEVLDADAHPLADPVPLAGDCCRRARTPIQSLADQACPRRLTLAHRSSSARSGRRSTGVCCSARGASCWRGWCGLPACVRPAWRCFAAWAGATALSRAAIAVGRLGNRIPTGIGKGSRVLKGPRAAAPRADLADSPAEVWWFGARRAGIVALGACRRVRARAPAPVERLAVLRAHGLPPRRTTSAIVRHWEPHHAPEHVRASGGRRLEREDPAGLAHLVHRGPDADPAATGRRTDVVPVTVGAGVELCTEAHEHDALAAVARHRPADPQRIRVLGRVADVHGRPQIGR